MIQRCFVVVIVVWALLVMLSSQMHSARADSDWNVAGRVGLPAQQAEAKPQSGFKTYLPAISTPASRGVKTKMGDWSIVVPQATKNLFVDPSFENSPVTTYWTVDVGGGTGSAAYDTTHTLFGVGAIKLTRGTVRSNVYQSVTTIAGAHVISAYVYKDGGVVTASDFNFTIDGNAVAPDSFELVGRGWYRAVKVVTETAAAHNTGVRAVGASSIWVDGAQFEAGVLTTYCDGDQDGCAWDGAAHASTSSRTAQRREGGVVTAIDSGSDVLVTLDTGTGMPPLTNLTQERAILPGSHYVDTKVNERVIQLTISAAGSSPANLHALRKQLIALINPDAVTPRQPFLLRYSGTGNAVLEIPVVYDSGLGLNEWSGNAEMIALRLIAYDEPLWREIGNAGVNVTSSSSFTANYIAGRIDGAWGNLGGGMNGYVTSLVVAPDGSLYAGGIFTTAGGVTVNYVAKWNGSAWSALSTGMDNTVNALVVAPDGTLYAGGLFHVAGGVTVNHVAKWNGSAWSALGTGMNNTVSALVVAPDGSLYAGGYFTTAGGATVNNVAKWNGSAWSALSTGVSEPGGSQVVSAFAIAPDGSLYAGGYFTTAGGVSATSIAKWNGSAWSALSAGITEGLDEAPTPGAVFALALAPDGTLYAGGQFFRAGTAAANHIAKWNGSAWSAMGTGMGAYVYSLAFAPDGTLYAGGNFTTAGGLALADRVACWNGSTWSPLDIDLPGSPAVYKIALWMNGMYLAFDTSGTAISNAPVSIATTASNPSTAQTYPVIKVKRTAGTSTTLTHIRNENTGKTLYFNYPLADGETVTIDLRPGHKSVTSSAFGNMLSKVLPNSDFASWGLLPGANALTFYIVPSGNPTITTTMVWKAQHWSVDGGAN